MLKEERHQEIMKELQENGSLKVMNIAQKLSVTEMTIRRDLKLLEQAALLKRVHGGAVSEATINNREFSHSEKKILHVEAKKEIAAKGAKLVENNDVIFIGAGTTCEYMAKHLVHYEIKVVTNSIAIFHLFSEYPQIELILVGGRYRQKTGSFIGNLAKDVLAKIYVSKAFFGVNRINFHGVSTNNEEEAVVLQELISNADQQYVLVDRSKLVATSFYNLASLDQLTAVIMEQSNSKTNELGKYVKCL
ncbi:MAG: DeoR/GlpR family DNA-binding transcription regulator [Culicoidibacterales bacterium]